MGETSDKTPAESGHDTYQVGGKKFTANRKYSYVWAHITSAASNEQRREAYAFNLACLTKWGGCKDSNELLSILKSSQ
jgi:hypothetical protein